MNKNHPHDVGLTYWQHLKFAWGECFRLGCMEFVMFVHGLLPWVWDQKFSKYLQDATDRVQDLDRK